MENKKTLVSKKDILNKYDISETLYGNYVYKNKLTTIKIKNKNYHPLDEVEAIVKDLEERRAAGRIVYQTHIGTSGKINA